MLLVHSRCCLNAISLSFFIRVLMANRITLARLVHQSPFSTLIRMRHKIIALDFIKNASFCVPTCQLFQEMKMNRKEVLWNQQLPQGCGKEVRPYRLHKDRADLVFAGRIHGYVIQQTRVK